jgi:A/G-specific adenine glycosylase
MARGFEGELSVIYEEPREAILAGTAPGARPACQFRRAIQASVLSDRLLSWYAVHRRALPWRTDRSPYNVVVSEFMLQQTPVERVLPAFALFIAEFPSFAALAGAPTDAVLRAWRGLGYNARAVRLQRLARVVCDLHGGTLPREYADLRKLPGVGSYTACAIRAFAFDCDDVALDTNVRRVVHRVLFGIEWPPRATPSEIDAGAARLLPSGRANDVNSALMDLGAKLCTARAPKCLLCPLRGVCAAAPVDAARLSALARKHARRRPQDRIPFERTTRFLRGRIVEALRALPARAAISLLDLHGRLEAIAPSRTVDDLTQVSGALARDGIVQFDGASLCLAREERFGPAIGDDVDA